MAKQRIILLDLYATLCENPAEVGKPWNPRIDLERYRQWLVELLREEYVALVTWRHVRYEAETLARIQAQTAWLPNEHHFNETQLSAPVFKSRIVQNKLFPKHGDDPTAYIGLESNDQTRRAYAELGIDSLPVPKAGTWTEIPENRPVVVPAAQGPPSLF